MANAVKKIRACFQSENRPLTLADIRLLIPDLLPSEISSSLCHLMRLKKLSREQVEFEGHRKKVWRYTVLDLPQQ